MDDEKILVVLLVCFGGLALGCNEAICSSVVSRCTLLKSCDCELEATGCSCCKSCFACLEHLQVECCSCVGLCPGSNATVLEKSVLADIIDPASQTLQYQIKKPSDGWEKIGLQPDPKTPNCTVMYHNQCMGEKKCEKTCMSVGAGSYRWFHNGCCECVGQECQNDGISEGRCRSCSDDEASEELNPAELSDEEMKALLDDSENHEFLPSREKSTAAGFHDPIPQLWQAITLGEDTAGRWHIYTFPEESNERESCSVIYLNESVAEEKCAMTCRTRGAGKYRWFPNGCCECVAEECQGYGSNESRCDIDHPE